MRIQAKTIYIRNSKALGFNVSRVCILSDASMLHTEVTITNNTMQRKLRESSIMYCNLCNHNYSSDIARNRPRRGPYS